jgi:hypothetical protein
MELTRVRERKLMFKRNQVEEAITTRRGVDRIPVFGINADDPVLW